MYGSSSESEEDHESAANKAPVIETQKAKLFGKFTLKITDQLKSTVIYLVTHSS
jgi:hypothetical protein